MTSHGASTAERAEVAAFVVTFLSMPPARKASAIQKMRDEGFGQFADIFQRIADRDAGLDAEDAEVVRYG